MAYKNPEKDKAYYKKYYAEHSDELKQKTRARYKTYRKAHETEFKWSLWDWSASEHTCSHCHQTKPTDQFYYGRHVCRKCFCKNHTAYQKRNPEMRRRWARNVVIRKYGIEPQEYARLLSQQNGVCAICGKAEQSHRGNLHIDHDHTTNAIRGLLCLRCNTGLGLFQDDIQLLHKVIQYIVSHQQKGTQLWLEKDTTHAA